MHAAGGRLLQSGLAGAFRLGIGPTRQPRLGTAQTRILNPVQPRSEVSVGPPTPGGAFQQQTVHQVRPVPLRPAQLHFSERLLRVGDTIHQSQHNRFGQRQVGVLRIRPNCPFQQIQPILFSVEPKE